jgi:hypothetical protein
VIAAWRDARIRAASHERARSRFAITRGTRRIVLA